MSALWQETFANARDSSLSNVLIEFFCLTFNMCHRLCMADYEEVFRRIMEFEKSGPATEPLGVSQGAAEHLPSGNRPVR